MRMQCLLPNCCGCIAKGVDESTMITCTDLWNNVTPHMRIKITAQTAHAMFAQLGLLALLEGHVGILLMSRHVIT